MLLRGEEIQTQQQRSLFHEPAPELQLSKRRSRQAVGPEEGESSSVRAVVACPEVAVQRS